MNLRFVLLAICLIAASYLLYLGRPYSLSSDIAYQGFAARQYVEHVVPVLHSVQLVNPGDLSKDVRFYLTFWTPCWTFLFVLALKAGLTLGTAARLLTLILSIIGAIGWVWITSIFRLKGIWRVAAVTVSALFCLRTGAPFILGTGDLIVYAVAPWLIGASILIGDRLQFGLTKRMVAHTALLCLALGCVYWLKFSGIFLSIPIACALVLEHLQARSRPGLAVLTAIVALYGAAFSLPILAHKVYTHKKAGTDLLESSVGGGPPRTAERNRRTITETAYNVSGVWFSAEPGLARFIGGMPASYETVVRAPGLAIFAVLLYLLRGYSSRYIRRLLALFILIPLVAFPALTYATGIIVVQGVARCCAPFWIVLELFIFVLLSQPLKRVTTGFRYAKVALAMAAGVYLLFFLWFPLNAMRDYLTVRKQPAYETSASGLYVPDLSRRGTAKIDAQIRSLIQSPRDVVIPAAYSERTFGIDMWIELGGRLLPLTVDMAPSMRTHGHEGANFYGRAPFHSSGPLRVILVTSNLYGRPSLKYSPGAEPCDFRGCVERIQGRFPQATQWMKGPDTGGHAEIWFADLR